jgi:hypothetical protein
MRSRARERTLRQQSRFPTASPTGFSPARLLHSSGLDLAVLIHQTRECARSQLHQVAAFNVTQPATSANPRTQKHMRISTAFLTPDPRQANPPRTQKCELSIATTTRWHQVSLVCVTAFPSLNRRKTHACTTHVASALGCCSVLQLVPANATWLPASA